MRHIILLLLLLTSVATAQQTGDKPLYITDLAPYGDNMVVLSKGAQSVYVTQSDLRGKIREWNIGTTPTGVAINGAKAYVTADYDKLFVIDLTKDEVPKPITVGAGAHAPIVVDGKLYVLNQFADDVMEVDPTTGTIIRKVRVLREPAGEVASKEGNYLFVTNFLPFQRADVDYVAGEVSVIDLRTFKVVKNIKLANGSNALHGIALSEDGKYVFVSHNLGRFTVPTSQLQQGWMNTSAMSVIDVQSQAYVGAVILDEPERGAAGVWDIKTAGGKIFVSHSGTHDLSVIEYQPFIDKLKNYKGGVETLSYDLRFMYGLRQRLVLAGNGPRKMAVNGNKLYVPTYFSDDLNLLSIDDNMLDITSSLLDNRTETLAQKGERIFNDATYCFQNWQSCNGCHPGDARTDGLNWDLMNDGTGNSKNCKSLLYSIQTPPSMISGIRTSAELAIRKGFTHIQFFDVSDEWATAVDEYIKTLEAVPSPYLVDGKLSEKAQKGRVVFENLRCDVCHSGPYYTDMKMHRIGADIEFEAGWDTPTLREVWRTAPYLFDGRAATMRDVFEVHKHGINKKLSSKELDELSEYVLSL